MHVGYRETQLEYGQPVAAEGEGGHKGHYHCGMGD